MSETDYLDEMLAENFPAEEEASPVEDESKEVEQEKEPPSEDESEKSEGVEEGSSPEPSSEITGLKAGITAERKKRQAEQAENEKLRQELAALQKKPAPDVLEDPDGFSNHVTQDAATTAQNLIFNQSEALLRREIGEDAFNTLLEEFEEAAKEDQSIYQRVMGSAIPYQTMQDEMRILNERKQLSDPNFLQGKVGEEVKKVEARLRAEYEEKLKTAQGIPPSGANKGSQGVDAATAKATAEDTFDELFDKEL